VKEKELEERAQKIKTIFHEDSGHGWLEVDLDLFIEICPPEYVNKSDIYGFGYWDVEKSKVYLEEDCEAPDFCKRLDAKYGEDSYEVEYTYCDGYSPIRKLPRFGCE